MHPRRDGLRDVGEQAPRAADSQVSGKRRIVIITGLSGAGKSNALQAFEDAGYFCIDNLPPRMIPAVMETTAQGNGGPDGVVVVVDMRGRRYFGEELERHLANLREMADVVVDTSGYSALDTRLRFKKLAESFSSRITVSLISFGFKHGTPL